MSTPRHRCFLSYHGRDRAAMETFVDDFDERTDLMITTGVVSDDDFIDSDNFAYVNRQIRKRYLQTSTVTIVLIGTCTWSRRFVDWEVAASLAQPASGLPNGLLAIDLSGNGLIRHRLPDRVALNVESGYAQHRAYPRSGATLANWIHEAWLSRTVHARWIENPRVRRSRNSPCP